MKGKGEGEGVWGDRPERAVSVKFAENHSVVVAWFSARSKWKFPWLVRTKNAKMGGEMSRGFRLDPFPPRGFT